MSDIFRNIPIPVVIPVCEMVNLETGKEWIKFIPSIRDWYGNEKNIPKVGEREGNEKFISMIREREFEAFISENGREREFPLTPVAMI